MGHAIGFNHEQSRSDRDGFVRIRNENIPPPLQFNFNKLPTNQVTNLGVAYDYRSVMHYGARVSHAHPSSMKFRGNFSYRVVDPYSVHNLCKRLKFYKISVIQNVTVYTLFVYV
jgi:hypothetical protein